MQVIRLIEQVLRNVIAYKVQNMIASIGLVSAVSMLYIALSFSDLAKATAVDALGGLQKPVVTLTLYPDQPEISSNMLDDALRKAPAGLSGMGYIRIPLVAHYKGRPIDAHVIGASITLLDELDMTVRTGGLWSSLAITSHARQCVIGSDVAEKIGDNPIGEVLVIGDVACDVIGVLAPRREVGQLEVIPNQMVWIPLSTAIRFHQRDAIQTLYFTTRDADSIEWIDAQLLKWGVARYHWQDTQTLVKGLEAQHSILKNSLYCMTALLFFMSTLQIASIFSLNFRARCKEMGLRYCLGATPQHLWGLFMIEALFVGIFSGLVGVIFGVLMTMLLTYALEWIYTFSPVSAAISLSLAVGTVIISGIYPAYIMIKHAPIRLLNFKS